MLLKREMKMCKNYKDNEVEISVRFNEQDDMGMVHNSVYYIWFEISRSNFANNFLSISYEAIGKLGIMSPVVHSECKYLKPARYPDKIKIKCFYEPDDKNVFILHYIVEKVETGERLAVGKTINVFTDIQGKLLFKKPDFMLKAIEAIGNQSEFIWDKKRR